MKVKALISFAGAFTMAKGEIKECSDKTILQDLLQAGYVEKVQVAPKRSVKKSENK